MCGIAGLIRRDGGPADLTTIRHMTDSVRHRGPDGGECKIYGPVALGHRRLSVIDLSDAGRQPMEDATRQLSITFNGEIYNYLELRAELGAMGYQFASGTDTEVILAAYSAWGKDCVARFNGMWAFAILDRRNGIVFCSRDRFGVKPFYYIATPTYFAFGSEIRQLLPVLGRAKANQEAVTTYLITDRCDLGEATFFDGVTKLLGGHSLIYDLASHSFTIDRFYRLEPSKGPVPAADDAAERLVDLLRDAVRIRLRSDVKVGTCLSGGLDSSTVATLASELYRHGGGSRFSAITAVSEQESNNERHFAEAVVNASDLDWHTVRPSYQDFHNSLPAVVEAQEEPFGSPSLTMQYFVMKAARDNGITVLLDGQGGDEVLLGYTKYYAAYIARSFREGGVAAAANAARYSMHNNASLGIGALLKYLVGGLVAPARYAYYKHQHRYFLHHPPAPAYLKQFSRACMNEIELQRLEIDSTNLPPLLRYEDKNSMAHAIEARLPFMDYRVVEASLALPFEYKMRDGWTKWILRKAMDKKMPHDVVWRKNKFGFEAPEDIWLTAHLSEMQHAVLSSQIIRSLTDTSRLKSDYPNLDKRSRWRLYSLALWENMFHVTA